MQRFKIELKCVLVVPDSVTIEELADYSLAHALATGLQANHVIPVKAEPNAHRSITDLAKLPEKKKPAVADVLSISERNRIRAAAKAYARNEYRRGVAASAWAQASFVRSEWGSAGLESLAWRLFSEAFVKAWAARDQLPVKKALETK